jgi:hypothetical protein
LPGDTQEIYRMTASGVKISGQPADSCWLFKAVSGKISAYSYLAEVGYSYVIAIQDTEEENQPIVPLTKKNLEAMVGTPENDNVLKLIEKGKLVKALEAYNSESPQ